ncbi:MAG: tRNA (adenosine(37)-N6)-threonylcarbamoyltransferase complex ATPase subunit type 1 TsaE [Candidatus Paceibacterota bacterium]|jgi:tRNA threonylcarbamoyladenosine biosynthesis protein TsaE
MLSKNIKETEKIAKIFLNKILKSKKSNDRALVVGLSGDLGAGKTAFTKSVAKHLGIKEKIFSPTYVIFKKYLLPLRRGSAQRAKGSNFKFFFHMDAYRLENEKELLNLGWEEIINNKEHLIFIEWPENIAEAMPLHSKYVYISDKKSGHKDFKFK